MEDRVWAKNYIIGSPEGTVWSLFRAKVPLFKAKVGGGQETE